MTPQQGALKAIFVFLRESGFSPMWDGSDILKIKSLGSNDIIWDTFQIYFLEGDLCINRARIAADDKQVGLRFGMGAQFLELADPRCFDHILEVLQGKRMAIEEW